MASLQSKDIPQDKMEEMGVRLASRMLELQGVDNLQLISHYSYAMQLKYHSYLISIIPAADTEFKNNSQQISRWAHKLQEILADHSLSLAESFAKAKYFLEELFFSCTEKGTLHYTYHMNALLNSADLQKELGISRATVSRYVKLGMEATAATGHHRYPIHNIFYWKNGVWASKVQALQERYRIRNRTKEQLILELQEEVQSFESAYNSTFQEIFGDIKDPYALTEPDDYFNWRNAIEELEKTND